MSRFKRQDLLRFSARDAVLSVALTGLLLLLFAGSSVLRAGEEKRPGVGHDLLVKLGKPVNWVAAELPLQDFRRNLTAPLSPDSQLSAGGGFKLPGARTVRGAVPPVTPEAFDPVQLGGAPPPRRPLHTLLVTGDSLSQPLDLELARSFAPEGVDVIRDPHVGTGISNDVLVDWGRLSTSQVGQDHPDAVVVFIGANEGYPLPAPGGKEVQCCGPDWAAAFANRARQMMNNYRQGGAARVYWLTVPTPRDPARQRVSHVVNAAIEVAAEPWRSEVRIIDTVPIFTPGERYRDAMEVDGEQTIVRESDGIHLNQDGSALAAKVVLEAIGRDFEP